MGNTVFIVWRESIEAMLVIGILYNWLKNTAQHNPQASETGMRFLWCGVFAGLALAIALALVMLKVQSELADQALQYFQIGMMLFAAFLITQMVLWMRQHAKNMQQDLSNKMQTALSQTNWWGIFFLAALAVGREGAETVIFLYGAGASQQTSLFNFAAYAFLGFALAFLSFWILSKGTRYFSWQLFFRVSECLLLLLSAALLVNAVDQLIGMGWIPAIIDPLWDTSALLDDSSKVGGFIAAFTGYRAYPALSLLLIYLSYWLGVILLINRTSSFKREKNFV